MLKNNQNKKYIFNIILLSSLYSNDLKSNIIHEEIPFFIPEYPIFFDINFSADYKNQIERSEIYYSTTSRQNSQIMRCAESSCYTLIDTFDADNYLEYIIRVSLKNGESLETPVIKIKKVAIPEWQSANNMSSFEIIEGKDKNNINGFSLNGFVVMPENLKNKNSSNSKLNQESKDQILLKNNNELNNQKWWEFWYRKERETP